MSIFDNYTQDLKVYTRRMERGLYWWVSEDSFGNIDLLCESHRANSPDQALEIANSDYIDRFDITNKYDR